MSHPLDRPPEVIETPASLAAMLDHLRCQSSIAVDTESNSLYAYRERVCLIQVSTPETDYIVDTLALADIAGLGLIFANPAIEKVFHGADYDVGTLRRDYGFEFAHLFDTMLASRILGIKQFSLGSLLQERFGVQLDKRMQRHNWGRRPLQPAELAYARLDTHYLLPLRDLLLAELRQRGREREARESFERVTSTTWSRKPFDADDFWHIKGAMLLDDAGRGVLRALFALRDAHARRLDRPPFKVLSDDILVEIARSRPSSRRALRQVYGLSAAQVEALGADILHAVAAGQREPQPRHSRPLPNGRPDDAVLERYERLREWRKERAAQRDVAPDVLISNHLLMEIAHRAPTTREALSEIEGIGPYQLEAYGQDILNAVAGEAGAD